MASKKYNLLFGMLSLLTSAAVAQPGVKGGVNDSSVIPSKRMPQQNEFWNGSYNFPAKPRNMWEVGVSTGIFTVGGDVSSVILTYPNFAVHVRKAFGYVFSMRVQYVNAYAKGLSWLASENFNNNPAWNTNLPVGQRYFSPERLNTGQVVLSDHNGNFSPTQDVVYYNYKTNVQDLSVQGIVTLNNIRFHKQKTGLILYAGLGFGATVYSTKINALDEANNTNYRQLYNQVFAKYGPGDYKTRKDIIKDLKAGMDKTYETDADGQGTRRAQLMGGTLKPSGTVIAGVAFKLGRRVNLAIEDRWTFVKDDLLDGQRWQEHAKADPVLTRDFDSYNYASLGLNFNLGAKAVEPLWWLNPLDYAYDELMNHRHVKIPKNDCPDTDGDGVCDHLDREQNTPANCPVDTHGVTKDTDGDGVPDCRDKQLITPTECQPSDADGIGHCPDPECCSKPHEVIVDKSCTVCDYPSLTMKGLQLSADNKAMLATVAAKLKANPNCTIIVNGYPATSKSSQATCQKRLDAVKSYLRDTEGISADRITTNCQYVKDASQNAIDIKCNQ
jgi:hypothetical protein